jgi:hypothetical protein
MAREWMETARGEQPRVKRTAKARPRASKASTAQDPPTGWLCQTPEALRAHQKAEIAKWWPIIKAAGIKVE